MLPSDVIIFRWLNKRHKSERADGSFVAQKFKTVLSVYDIVSAATNDGSGSKKRPVTFRRIIYIGGSRGLWGENLFRQYVKGC